MKIQSSKQANVDGGLRQTRQCRLSALMALIAFLSISTAAFAQGPRQCEVLKNHEARLKRASEALNRALGAEAARRGTAAGEAAANSAIVAGCYGAYQPYGFVVLLPAAYGAYGACENAKNNPNNATARSDCERANGIYVSALKAFDPCDKAMRAADKALGELISTRPPEEVRRAAEEMRDAIQDATNDFSSCVAEVNKLDPKKIAPAPGGLTGPQAPTGPLSMNGTFGTPLSNSFDADVAGFHVKLENGSVTRPNDTKLAGTVSIWPKNNPALKLLVHGNVYLKAGGGPQSVYGDGSADLTYGGNSIALPDLDFNTPDGNSISGTGKFQRYGHTFDISYNINAQNFTGQGEWRGRSKGWQSVPGVEVEYQVSNPSLKISFNGATATATLDADKIEVRTKARNSQGEPWAKAEINPDPLTLSLDGRLQLPMPSLPQPPDPNKTTREACEATAKQLKQDPGPCSGKFPPPPGLPNLPQRIEVQVSVVIE